MNRNQRLEAVRKVLVRTASIDGVVLLTDVDGHDLMLLRMTLRGFIQFVRLNTEEWGGHYEPSRKLPGDPRAFRDTELQTRWTKPKYRLKWAREEPS